MKIPYEPWISMNHRPWKKVQPSLKGRNSKQLEFSQLYLIVGEPEIQKLEKSGRKVAEF